MFAIIGIVVVIGSIISGYMVEHGNLSVLFQPAEVVIIGGAALGSFFISSPAKVIKLVASNFGSIFKASTVDKETCIELLLLLNKLFRKARQEGMLALEQDVNDPANSDCFNEFHRVTANEALVEFICDNFKVAISSGMDPHELEDMMDLDIEARHSEAGLAGTTVKTMADSLPGLGIVAAVLGVVITMGKINEPPEVLGHSIGAALVGTFLGVLACYGFVGPMGSNLEQRAKDEEALFIVIKTAIAASVGGAAPVAALEYGRRAIPGKARPTIQELDEAIKTWGNQK
jgi:chemotaxis protein MotA